MSEWLSFRLPDDFVDQYKDRTVNWGFAVGAGNTLGEIVFYNNYSRIKTDGSKERWYEVCRRVVEGVYSILKDHCSHHRTHWNEHKAQASAKEAYDRMFEFKWTPPGRGIWAMGTEMVNGEWNSSPLFNCSVLSTQNISNRSVHEATYPFRQMCEESMSGIGVGYDTRGAGKLILHQPAEEEKVFVVPDSREGWAESFAVLLESFFFESRPTVEFDYTELRPAGAPLKRFGGTASGYKPLEKSHNKIVELLSDRSGEKITSRDINDIMCLIGKAVVAGGSRRSATLCLGEFDDKEFINLKNWGMFPERNGPDGWSYMSNNSVVVDVGQDYDQLVEQIADNGEPGLQFLEVAKKYGRIGELNGQDTKIVATNPCQPGWARVLTPVGVRRLSDVEIGDQIWSESGWTRITNKWLSGQKMVKKFSTNAGVFYGTENHRIVSGGVKEEVGLAASVDILSGPQLPTPKHDPQIVMDGIVLGDGSVHKASNDLVYLYVGEKDQDYLESEVEDLLERPRPGITEEAWEIQTNITAEELPHTYERSVPDRYKYGTADEVASFLRGLYTANGSVVGGQRITLKQSSLKLIEDVQEMLSSIGIRSYYTTNKSKAIEFQNGTYECKESYDLNITSDRATFARMVGFIQQYKTDKLDETVERISSGRTKGTYDIVSVEELGVEDVYDITVDNDTHTYWTSCLNVSNCGEIFLESTEKCNLSEIYPTNHESLHDFLRTIKFAFIYNKAVTLVPTQWPEVNEVINRNRRIGLSVSGSALFAERHGWSEFRTWLDAAYGEVCRWDETYSKWLGIRESIRKTTSKPSGSVSILAGVTPGVHWPTHSVYIRRMRLRKDSSMVKVLTDAGYHVEEDVMDPENTAVVELPTRGPDVRTEKEVSLWEKTAMAALVQKHFADNAVSFTGTFLPEEKDQLSAVLRAFEGQVKAVSFLPITDRGSYAQMPYEAISEEEYDRLVAKIKPLDWTALYQGDRLQEAAGERFCSNDRCEIT